MRFIHEILKDNPFISAMINQEEGLGGLSLHDEAILLSNLYNQDKQPLFIVKPNLYQAQKLYERMTLITNAHVFLFAREDYLRVQSIAKSPELLANQIDTIVELLKYKNCICITHIGAIMYPLTNVNEFQNSFIKIKVDQEFTITKLKEILIQQGYEHVNRVDQPLCFANRGGIIDIFPIHYENPIRIEFFGDSIESIRYFNVDTQKTIKLISCVELVPASLYLNQKITENTTNDIQFLLEHENSSTILDYMNNPKVILSNYEEITRVIEEINEDNIVYFKESYDIDLSNRGFIFHIDTIEKNYATLKLHTFLNNESNVFTNIERITLNNVNFEKCMEECIRLSDKKKVIICIDHHEYETIQNYLKNHFITYKNIKGDEGIEKNGLYCVKKEIYEGFVYANEYYILGKKDIFKEKVKVSPYKNKFKESKILNNYMELEIGDYVVHKQYGIGKYLGIENKVINQIHKDFLKVSYYGNDVLLIPLHQFQLIRKYVGKEGRVPKLNKLGSGEWEKTKRKVSEKVNELADRLIKLYSIREAKQGFSFSKDTPYQKQFEDDFIYELTKDQQKAVDEIKKDMESNKPMDRLLCGDVGFGKTEVAIRASFKAIMDKKQVAFLCPTTILSLQHYKTYIKRFENFPVEIAVLNRFVSVKERKNIIKRLEEGKIDIIIGTHRLLSKDVKFHDLGLLVIDEEQRFGVEHKEKIKEIRNTIDVLSMSATPIPRTLQMSLIGIRQLSQLETPPNNRMPVQTYVIEKDFRIIKEIIERELLRNGQVYYLYNDVKEIYRVAEKIKSMIDDVEVGVAHGQMTKNEIEDVMFQFTEGKYQVLVCTTIIETGIDIPNANTMIIDQADTFGLSQLYQIKGRVGRSDRLAYAYLMYTPNKQLTEVAYKRLKSIKEFTQLGSGYKIAMRDLAIRGAGDMLGPQQAGFMDTIGLDLYIEMLHDAIAKKKDGVSAEEIEEANDNSQKNVNILNIDAYIPQEFTNSDYEKICLYQQIESIKNTKDLFILENDIIDQYGKLPKSVSLLFEKKHMELLMYESHIEEFKEQKQDVQLIFTKEWSSQIDGALIFEKLLNLQKDARIQYMNQKIIVIIKKQKNWLKVVNDFLQISKL